MKTKTFKRPLFHLGTLDANNKGERGASHEGNGLSVSECPDAWRRIAKLGGLPTWTLQKPGNQFLHLHKLTTADRQTILDYALDNGWAALQSVWVATTYDSEQDCALEAYYPTEQDARDEVCEEDDPDGAVCSREVPVALLPLINWLGFAPSQMLVPSMLATLYADKVLGFDGVFWEDLLDVSALSAPRAVISAGKLETWKIEKA